MSAYFIVDVVWKDDTSRKQYLAAVGATLESYGGRVAVAGPAEQIEGNWRPELVVVLEFDSVERARAWYVCDEYEKVKPFRHQGAESKMILVGNACGG